MDATMTENIQNIENLNTISKLEDLGFEGIDEKLSISLFEYGFIYSELPEDNSIIVIYSLGRDRMRFERAVFSKDTDVFKEYDWVDWEVMVPEYVVLSLEGFKQLELQDQLFHLYSYLGYEQIFGKCYWNGFLIDNDADF